MKIHEIVKIPHSVQLGSVMGKGRRCIETILQMLPEPCKINIIKVGSLHTFCIFISVPCMHVLPSLGTSNCTLFAFIGMYCSHTVFIVCHTHCCCIRMYCLY